MFTKLQAIIPFEGPRWMEDKPAQLDVDADEGLITITMDSRKFAAEILEVVEGMDKDFELHVEMGIRRKES